MLSMNCNMRRLYKFVNSSLDILIHWEQIPIIRTESDMTEARTKFIKTLTFIQNRVENANRDILTITGLMDDREVSQHVIREAT